MHRWKIDVEAMTATNIPTNRSYPLKLDEDTQWLYYLLFDRWVRADSWLCIEYLKEVDILVDKIILGEGESNEVFVDRSVIN